MTEANAVLVRFAPQIRWITESILRSFELESHWLDDLRQDACILVLSYAGILPSTHYGRLDHIEKEARGDPVRVHNILAATLRMDLTQQVIRVVNKTLPSTSIYDLIEDQEFDLEDPTSEADLYNQEHANRLMRKYPELSMQALEGMSVEQIMEKTDRSKRTIMYRIADQKRSFLTDALRRAKLVIEGDETMDELEEAYIHVTKVRR